MHRRAKNAVVVLAGLVLAVLGVYNIVLKATWTVMDDGVLWRSSPQGLVAARMAPDGPRRAPGSRPTTCCVAIDGDEVLSPARLEQVLVGRRAGDHLTYSLLRLRERRALDVRLQPVPRGNVSAFYYLSLVGFFSLVVGTVVTLRRPGRPHLAALLRGLRAVLPGLLDLVRGQARRDRLDLRLDRPPRRRSSCRSSTCTSA